MSNISPKDIVNDLEKRLSKLVVNEELSDSSLTQANTYLTVLGLMLEDCKNQVGKIAELKGALQGVRHILPMFKESVQALKYKVDNELITKEDFEIASNPLMNLFKLVKEKESKMVDEIHSQYGVLTGMARNFSMCETKLKEVYDSYKRQTEKEKILQETETIFEEQVKERERNFESDLKIQYIE